jgi:hypothetical protein
LFSEVFDDKLHCGHEIFRRLTNHLKRYGEVFKRCTEVREEGNAQKEKRNSQVRFRPNSKESQASDCYWSFRSQKKRGEGSEEKNHAACKETVSQKNSSKEVRKKKIKVENAQPVSTRLGVFLFVSQ